MDPRAHSPRSYHFEGRGEDAGEDEPLREEDVTAADRLDDRVQEADGLGDGPTELPEDDRP